MGLLGGAGGTSKQSSTMPNVVIGCCARRWPHWGALWGRKFCIWERTIYCQPIWDVFAPEQDQGQVGEQTTMHFRSLSFPIRQGVPVGFLRLGFPVGLLGMVLCT